MAFEKHEKVREHSEVGMTMTLIQRAGQIVAGTPDSRQGFYDAFRLDLGIIQTFRKLTF